MMPRALAIVLAVLAAGPTPARLPSTPATPAARPLYYDRRIEREDLRDRSVEELRLMRNAIYARAGREFKDPELRAQFAKQPWYRPSATPAKLSARDEKNLANIKNWEPLAKTVADLRSLVPGWRANGEVFRPTDCHADAKGVPGNRKQEGLLLDLARRLDWSTIDAYRGEVSDTFWAREGMKKPEVHLSCAFDLDADGTPEAIVRVSRHYKQKEFVEDAVGIVLLVSGKAPHWRAVAPLGVDATIPGVEGARSTDVEVVKLAGGALALEVDTQSGGGGDCDQEFEKVSVLTLSGDKLIPVGSFDVSEPACLE
jgi:hypothetical protein